ncbi:MAG TPA: flippase [Balneolaceae bacterium]|nr:flippase [Balneolaceae bacterium]
MNLSSSSSVQKKGILARNTFINLAGKGLPLLFAVIAIPFVIKGLGTDRFGVLTIIWTVIGYFGLFDMGLGRATTKFVADQEARGEPLAPVIITSILLLMGFGLAGGGLIYGLTPYLVKHLLNTPSQLVSETVQSFYLLSVSIPVVLGAVGARGVLQAQQRFGLVNAVKIPASIINYVSPLLILPFTHHLQYIVLLLVIERAITFVVYLYFSLRGQHLFALSGYSFWKWSKNLLGFGLWLALSNIVSPIMVYMDRFIIGTILTMSAVAYYTTPYEVINRIGIISGSFMGVMFPAFSVYFLQGEEKLAAAYKKSVRYVLFIIIPIVTFLLFAAHPLLHLWLGEKFALQSTTVLQILAVGIFINSVARISGTLIQAAGRPDVRAKLHLIELPVYLALLWYLTHWLGINGVALAWLIRVFVDWLLLFYVGNRLTFFTIDWMPMLRKVSIIVLSVCAGMIIARQINSDIGTLGYAIACGLVVLYATWRYILQETEQQKLISLVLEMRSKVISGVSETGGRD